MTISNKKQTAVEWLLNELYLFEKGLSEYFSKSAIINHAMRMEKKQIIDAFDNAITIPNKVGAITQAWLESTMTLEQRNKEISEIPTNSEQYYKETYEQ